MYRKYTHDDIILAYLAFYLATLEDVWSYRCLTPSSICGIIIKHNGRERVKAHSKLREKLCRIYLSEQ